MSNQNEVQEAIGKIIPLLHAETRQSARAGAVRRLDPVVKDMLQGVVILLHGAGLLFALR